MEEEITLEELWHHPLVAELAHENATLKNQMQLAEKPEVGKLNDISLPYVIKNHLLIDQGDHNDVFYSAQILRMAVNQHEDLSIFLDHEDKTQTWVGGIKNPVWSEEDMGIKGDVEIVDPKSAMAIAYGAKFGLSATVSVDTLPNLKGGAEIAADPDFKSYSLVLEPAVRGTMLNEEQGPKGGREEMKEEGMEELKIKDDLKPALDVLNDAIKQATAKRDNDILVLLRQAKAILTKLAGSTYPYPGKEEKKKMDAEFEQKFDNIAKAISSLADSKEEEGEKLEESEKLEGLKAENEELKQKLGVIDLQERKAHGTAILAKEQALGLITKEGTEARLQELEAMDEKTLTAVEKNLDKTLEILEKADEKKDEELDAEPDTKRQETLAQKKTKAEIENNANQKLLDIMLKEQDKGHITLGGY